MLLVAVRRAVFRKPHSFRPFSPVTAERISALSCPIITSAFHPMKIPKKPFLSNQALVTAVSPPLGKSDMSRLPVGTYRYVGTWSFEQSRVPNIRIRFANSKKGCRILVPSIDVRSPAQHRLGDALVAVLAGDDQHPSRAKLNTSSTSFSLSPAAARSSATYSFSSSMSSIYLLCALDRAGDCVYRIFRVVWVGCKFL
jgi:hypothetical protein